MPSAPSTAATSLKVLSAAAVLALALAALWQADPRVGRLWLNTLGLACGACLVAVPLGTLMAIAIFKTNVPGRRPAALLLVALLFVPLYLVTGAWDAGFGIQGWHTLSTNPHLAREPWLAGWRAAVWVHGLAAVPWVVLIVGAALRAVEAEIEEDAATCAAPSHVLWHISLRRAAPAIAVAALWVTTVVSTEISVTDFFQVRTFAEEVYTQAALGTFDEVGPPSRGGQSAAQRAEEVDKQEAIGTLDGDAGPPSGEGPSAARLAAPTSPLPALSGVGLWSGLLLSTALALAVLVGVRRLFVDLGDAPQRLPWIWRLKRARWPAAILLWAGMLLLVGVPLANLLYKAGVQVTVADGTRLRHWSALKLVERLAAAPGEFRGELWLSTWLGAAAATAAVAIAVPLAWSMRRTSLSLRERVGVRALWLRLLAVAICFTIPGPLLGLVVIRLLNRPPDSPLAALAWLYDSNFAPWLVQTVRALPVVSLILWPAFASVPQVMLDTAATDGAGWWNQLLRIAVPQRWPAIAAAWLIGLAIAVGELAATVLVMPPQAGATALSIQVFQLLHYGVDDRVAAICLVMVLAIAAITGIAAALLRRKVV